MSERGWTLLSLWIHLPIVTTWVGLVMWDVFAAATPSLSAGQRGRMIAWSRPLVLLAIAVIMVTGIWQTMRNPFMEVNSYAELSELRGSTYGLALFWKHGFVLATFALTILVRFILAPRLIAPRPPGNAVNVGAVAAAVDTAQTERLILWLSALNLFACIAALIFATRMLWELH